MILGFFENFPFNCFLAWLRSWLDEQWTATRGTGLAYILSCCSSPNCQMLEELCLHYCGQPRLCEMNLIRIIASEKLNDMSVSLPFRVQSGHSELQLHNWLHVLARGWLNSWTSEAIMKNITSVLGSSRTLLFWACSCMLTLN